MVAFSFGEATIDYIYDYFLKWYFNLLMSKNGN